MLKVFSAYVTDPRSSSVLKVMLSFEARLAQAGSGPLTQRYVTLRLPARISQIPSIDRCLAQIVLAHFTGAILFVSEAGGLLLFYLACFVSDITYHKGLTMLLPVFSSNMTWKELCTSLFLPHLNSRMIRGSECFASTRNNVDVG